MSTLLANLVVVSKNDSGQIDLETTDNNFWELFKEDDDDLVSLDDGIKAILDYFETHGNKNEQTTKELNELIEEFKEIAEGLNCKFYTWGVEHDIGLMCVEQ